MFFTVEPMINIGDYKVKILSDGWTAVTSDKSLSAQFEHTIGVTNDGYEIFTLSKKNYTFPLLKIMIPRYKRKEISEIWESDNKFRIWLKIEILICEALHQKGKISKQSLKNIKKKSEF